MSKTQRVTVAIIDAVDWLNRHRVLIRRWLKELKAQAGVMFLFLSSSLFLNV